MVQFTQLTTETAYAFSSINADGGTRACFSIDKQGGQSTTEERKVQVTVDKNESCVASVMLITSMEQGGEWGKADDNSNEHFN